MFSLEDDGMLQEACLVCVCFINQDSLAECVQFSGKFEGLKALSFGLVSCSTAAPQAHHPLRAEQHLTKQHPFKHHAVPYTHSPGQV